MVKELEGITPPGDAILWRYMSLEKFANILAMQLCCHSKIRPPSKPKS